MENIRKYMKALWVLAMMSGGINTHALKIYVRSASCCALYDSVGCCKAFLWSCCCSCNDWEARLEETTDRLVKALRGSLTPHDTEKLRKMSAIFDNEVLIKRALTQAIFDDPDEMARCSDEFVHSLQRQGTFCVIHHDTLEWVDLWEALLVGKQINSRTAFLFFYVHSSLFGVTEMQKMTLTTEGKSKEYGVTPPQGRNIMRYDMDFPQEIKSAVYGLKPPSEKGEPYSCSAEFLVADNNNPSAVKRSPLYEKLLREDQRS